VTTRPDAIDHLSPAVRYQIANGLGWCDLRWVQALATEADELRGLKGQHVCRRAHREPRALTLSGDAPHPHE